MRVSGTIIRDRIESEVREMLDGRGVLPKLALLVVGDNPVIEGFVNVKKRCAARLGIEVIEKRFPDSVSTEDLLGGIEIFARDESIGGIVVQLPLPLEIPVDTILNAIPEAKDVDVLSQKALDRFEHGVSEVLPPVVGAVSEILRSAGYLVADRKVLVVGSGRLVGAPVATWLRLRGAHVTVLDKPSDHLTEYVRAAELVVSGAGAPGLIRPEMLTPGVALIDAGSSESLGKIVGDIDPLCEDVASFVTPVPGGVGPITVAVLFKNLALLSEKKQ